MKSDIIIEHSLTDRIKDEASRHPCSVRNKISKSYALEAMDLAMDWLSATEFEEYTQPNGLWTPLACEIYDTLSTMWTKLNSEPWDYVSKAWVLPVGYVSSDSDAYTWIRRNVSTPCMQSARAH